jgi:hypothetical protein
MTSEARNTHQKRRHPYLSRGGTPKKKALRRTGFDYITISMTFRIERFGCTYTRDPHLLHFQRWEGDSIPLAQRRFVASLIR